MKMNQNKMELLKPSSLHVENIRKDFPILSQKVRNHLLVYLDNAATSQKPISVIQAMNQHYSETNANVHRSVHALGEFSTQAFEGVRKKLCHFLGTEDEKEIIFTRGTTESMNCIMRGWGEENIQKDDTILVTRMEHHSHFVPWQTLALKKGAHFKIVELTSDFRIDQNHFKQLLEEQPRLVALTLMSNVLGVINPVHHLAQMAKEKGALVVVDGAQAISHLPVKIPELGPIDFFAFSSHKMLGPTGVGVLWGRKEILEKMSPYQFGGDMILEVQDEKTSWNELPWKFEAGTPPIAEVIGLGAAVDYLQLMGMERICNYEQELTLYALKKLKEIKGLRILGPSDTVCRGTIFSFVVEGIHPHDLATFLDSLGIAIRAGHHCAQPLHRKVGLVASARASFAFYNTLEEVDRLIEGIQKAKEYFR